MQVAGFGGSVKDEEEAIPSCPCASSVVFGSYFIVNGAALILWQRLFDLFSLTRELSAGSHSLALALEHGSQRWRSVLGSQRLALSAWLSQR